MNNIMDNNIKEFFNNKEILITGGTGSLGNAIVELLCKEFNNIKGIRILSRDELKQKEMKLEFDKKYNIPISYLLGDIRDLERLKLAMARVDFVIHAAALKDIVKCENDPIEAIKTNIEGSKNVVLASIYNGIKKCILISTDKAVYPVNLYGASKMVAERLFIDANKYSKFTQFSVCRYGNVVGSRGSVIQLFLKQKQEKKLRVTSFDMTRFWIKLDEVARFIVNCIYETKGKEIFIPKMQSCKIIDVARIIGDGCEIEEIGIRESEKIHECLITNEESNHCKILKDKYIVDYDYYTPLQFSYDSKNVIMDDNTLKEKIKEFL